MNEPIKVLDKGYIRLDAALADDLSVVNAARVSFLKKESELTEPGRGVIGYLMKNKHGTPFEHNYMRFEVKAPICVFREWHRHRIGISINEQSGRYMELFREFYIPAVGDVRSQTGKPGHYDYVPVSFDLASHTRAVIEHTCNRAFDEYAELIAAGVAKEQARFVLPVNTYSSMVWSCNARSLMAFLELRNDPNAQWEIRQYAIEMEKMFAELMPVTHAAFIANNHIAP